MRTTSTSALPDTCTITRPSATRTLNTTTMATTPGPATPVYSGACRIRPVDGQENDTEVASLLEVLGRYVVTLHYSADGIEVGDEWTGVTCTDGDLVDRTLWVKHVGIGSNLIDRRIIVQDREQPTP